MQRSFENLLVQMGNPPELRKLLENELKLESAVKAAAEEAGEFAQKLEEARLSVATYLRHKSQGMLFLRQRFRYEHRWYEIISIADFVIQCANLDTGQIRELPISKLRYAKSPP